tara:strand:+ start:2399 stop:2701 length:303 start_codon:yes stop_codon:yes gene_type:complete
MPNFKDWSSKRGQGKPRKNSGSKKDFKRNSGRRSFDKIQRTTVTCASCGQKCEVPFKPTSNKPVYCDNCFKKDSAPKSDRGNELKEINSKLNRILELLEE